MISVAPIIVYSTSVDNVYWQVSLALVASIAGLAGLSAIPANLKGVSQLFAAAFQNGSTWLRTLILAPDFRDHIGFMADVKSEIDLMKQVIADNDTDKPVRIAVFIDDLDRCPPTKAAEVLQAVMLLLSEESPQESDNSKSSNERGELRPNPFVIFLAIDTRIIANAIEEHYGKAIVKIGVTGYEYLDKVVQLPFAIPVPSEEDIRRYLDSMLANPSQERKTDEISGSPPKQLENEGVSPSTSEDTDQQVNHREQKDEADLISIAFTDFEKETFKRNIPFLNPNPRNLKRLINVYRLERLIADKRISANKLIDWVILTEQWPVLTSIVIALIKSAEHATKTEVDIRGIPLSEMYKRAEAALESDSLKHLSQLDWDYTTLRAFLQINQPSVRMTDLQTLKPITTNINPAILENVNRSLSTSE
jgi:hypothetical protein